MDADQGNLFAGVPVGAADEVFTALLERRGLKIERIVSNGQASPPGFWYDSQQEEWVLLLEGSAAVQIEGEAAPRLLQPGTWLRLPAHCRHRVAWTEAGRPTVWLAVHYDGC
ncbi:cupin [Cupriavidus sp. USMAA2-4]|uniref:Cupin n=1 Tax=Cupriavidus malaysiensis TaxID=367825 RepID=A0ABM6F4D5_9BURK|nr:MULTISPECIES: cupin domain-containing protein [Cupriavidus]AOY90673.1 cupin [Cupriavidus sp. USMAA2-4]AOY99702.1 cupin [Cupriavidus sp. USMAHM13]AOZ06325.1 cupin [Cupriavidus malaysiensis]